MIHKPHIAIIVAHNPEGIIGHQGQLPWHLPADLRYFKQITIGKTIIMGRKTHESIGRALPGRKNVVISRTQQHFAGCETYPSLEKALQANRTDDEIMIIGGGELYQVAMPMAHRIYQTLVDYHGPGDTFFPSIDPNTWQRTSLEDHPADAHNPYGYSFMVWDSRKHRDHQQAAP